MRVTSPFTSEEAEAGVGRWRIPNCTQVNQLGQKPRAPSFSPVSSWQFKSQSRAPGSRLRVVATQERTSPHTSWVNTAHFFSLGHLGSNGCGPFRNWSALFYFSARNKTDIFHLKNTPSTFPNDIRKLARRWFQPVTGFDKLQNLPEGMWKDAFRLKDCRCAPTPNPEPAAFSVLPTEKGFLFLSFSFFNWKISVHI